MRKAVLISTCVLVVVLGVPAAWLVTAADPSTAVRLGRDVTLEKDSDLITGVIPARTTIVDLFDNHMIDGAEGTKLVSSIASAIDVRRLRAGQPYSLDRLLDGRVRRFEYEIDNDRRLVVVRASAAVSPEPSAQADATRFIANIDRIPKQATV